MAQPSGRQHIERHARTALQAERSGANPGVILGLSVAAAASLAVLAVALRPAPLAAWATTVLDQDGDGLVDAQEAVLGSDPEGADTDGDGFADAEELARKSSPLDASSMPAAGALGLGMSARGEAGELRVVVAVYLEDGLLEGKTISFGALLGQRMVPLAPLSFTTQSKLALVDGAAPGSRVLILEIPIRQTAVHLLGNLTVFATVGLDATGTVAAADAVTLFAVEGVVYLQVPHQPRGPHPLVQSSGSIYVPIPPGGAGDIPVTLSPGLICFQQTQVVGVSGPMLTHEVVSSDCLPDWDAYCRSDCSGSVGDTFTSLDPSVLIGL